MCVAGLCVCVWGSVCGGEGEGSVCVGGGGGGLCGTGCIRFM